ncbi:Strobilurin A biosynthesis cluster protein l1 [Psilocybe cubensis]|uniref:Strobilurin A biosynthesis cluster protein l1 n=2 Tax=Psilocybe cubensis TaxID=181762 RepID=A0ACB8GXP7_PSICU|nr:Strobilurin A biosynthesis cluster protein l1 [Psilocybe cubensis]KAH9480254.1 Strobilurin A biosynthesis cluster protein l1 [Psilocybe cubensis]
MICFRLAYGIKTGHSHKVIKHLSVALFILSIVLVLCDVKHLRKFTTYYIIPSLPFIDQSDRPPTYDDLRKWEQNLPQHNLDLQFPEGKTGRYVMFTSSQVEVLGWNNKFINVEWTPHTPLNAFFSGPTAGGPWGPGDSSPRSISDKWYEVVCPKEERKYINTHDVKPAIYWEDGIVIFDHWRTILSEAPEQCIEVIAPRPEIDSTPQVFDLHLWGSGRSLSLWEEFKNSPVSQLLSASPIVRSAIETNLPSFSPGELDLQVPQSNVSNITPFSNTLSAHIRRGDFRRQCRHFWTWSSTYYNWNLLPFLLDRFDPPPGFSWGANIPQNLPIFLKRCWPDIPTIIKRIHDVREDYLRTTTTQEQKQLKTVYVMTNDNSPWLDELRLALKLDGWEIVLTTSDLILNAEQKEVGVSVDMEIGRRSELFIGNGVRKRRLAIHLPTYVN